MKPTAIQLPGEIGEQLRTICDALQKPATDVLASMIQAYGDHIGVCLPIRGVSIANKSDGIHVVLDDCHLQPMQPEQVLSLVGSIEATLSGKNHGELNLDLPSPVFIRRVGTGYALIVDEYRRVFAPSVIRALASQLRASAKRAAIG